MIQTFKNILGYTGNSELVDVVIVTVACVFICCLAYAMIDFINNLITHIMK